MTDVAIMSILVGTDDPYRHATGIRRNHRRLLHIAFSVQGDTEKGETLADPLPDERRILADAAGENEGVHAPEHCGERANPFLRLIAEER